MFTDQDFFSTDFGPAIWCFGININNYAIYGLEKSFSFIYSFLFAIILFAVLLFFIRLIKALYLSVCSFFLLFINLSILTYGELYPFCGATNRAKLSSKGSIEFLFLDVILNVLNNFFIKINGVLFYAIFYLPYLLSLVYLFFEVRKKVKSKKKGYVLYFLIILLLLLPYILMYIQFESFSLRHMWPIKFNGKSIFK